eukprot:596468-Amorphochlora_amoeboformis.AAC.1
MISTYPKSNIPKQIYIRNPVIPGIQPVNPGIYFGEIPIGTMVDESGTQGSWLYSIFCAAVPFAWLALPAIPKARILVRK